MPLLLNCKPTIVYSYLHLVYYPAWVTDVNLCIYSRRGHVVNMEKCYEGDGERDVKVPSIELSSL